MVYQVKHVFPNVCHLSVVAMLFPPSGKGNCQYQKIRDRSSEKRETGLGDWFRDILANLIFCTDKTILHCFPHVSLQEIYKGNFIWTFRHLQSMYKDNGQGYLCTYICYRHTGASSASYSPVWLLSEDAFRNFHVRQMSHTFFNLSTFLPHHILCLHNTHEQLIQHPIPSLTAHVYYKVKNK